VLAWEDIDDEKAALRLDESQLRQLEENVKKARRDVKEAVWRTYKNLMLLGKDGSWKTVDLGLGHSSAAPSLTDLIVLGLEHDGDAEKAVSPIFLARNWPPAFKEWSTKSVRDAFFASPQFPRLLNPDSLKDTIARGVENGMLGYVGKNPNGTYLPFQWKTSLSILDIEISDDTYVIQKETAEAYLTARTAPGPIPQPQPPVTGSPAAVPTATPAAQFPPQSPVAPTPTTGFSRVTWQGDVPPQKLLNFYTKVLSKFATQAGLRIGLNIEIAPQGGVSSQKLDEIRVSLRELGLPDEVGSE
jgi:hypothetical protein